VSADARGQTVELCQDRDPEPWSLVDQALLGTNPGCCAGGGPGHVLSPRPQAQRPPDLLRGWVRVSESGAGPRSWPTGFPFSTPLMISACGATQVGDPQEHNLAARLGEEEKRRRRLGECSPWQEAVAPPSQSHVMPSQPHACAHAPKATRQKTPDRGFSRAERPDGARLLAPRVLRDNRGHGGYAERLGEAGKF
jgi:hypothetical protein